MSYVTAFWVGGLICALCQILLEKTKLMPGRVMVILVCSGALLGAFNIYQPFVEFAEFLWDDLRQVPSGSVQR